MWFLFAFISATCDSIIDLLRKKSTQHVDEFIIIFQQRLYSLVILIPLMLLNIPKHFDLNQIWLPLVVVVTFDTLASIFYIKALKNSAISLIAPLVSLTPIGILLTSSFVNKELPSIGGIIGVLLSAVGVYVLQFSKRTEGLFQPFIYLIKDKGARLILGVILAWSITSGLDKVVVQLTNPFFYTGLVSTGYTLVLFFILISRSKSPKEMFGHTKNLMPIGLLQGTSLLFLMIAMPLTFVSYVVAIKLSSSVISVWTGKFFFKEKNIREKAIGSLIILLGIVLMIVHN